MLKITQLTAIIFLTIFTHRALFADMVTFDFDDIQSQSRKGPKAIDVEIYMEGLYGSGISVSQNTAAGRAAGSAAAAAALLQSPSVALGIHSGFLKAGKGSGSGISFDFGANPINSFSVDWLLNKGGRSFTILADGVVINQQILSKAQRKAGLSGHQGPYFFDDSVHKLEFIGVKKKSFAIDNLVINIPLPGSEEEPENPNEENEGNTNQTGSDPNENPGGNNLPTGLLDNPPGDTITQVTAAVPEPSSILMLVLGVCGAWLSRRIVAV